MGILGTIIFVYIVVHMQNFWYIYKFGETPFMTAEDGSSPLLKDGSVVKGGMIENGEVMLGGESLGPAMRDLYEIVIQGFQEPVLVLFYVIGMIAIAFHLIHGFQSGFQSFGLKNKKYGALIDKVGYAFAIVVPLLFAVIPVYLFLMK